MITSKTEGPNRIMHHNLFATLKYAVKAVSYFDGKNIFTTFKPLNYFIKSCEEAKSMLPNEAEPQFIKVIRIRIVERTALYKTKTLTTQLKI